jgi:hypothetical protein
MMINLHSHTFSVDVTYYCAFADNTLIYMYQLHRRLNNIKFTAHIL